MSDIEKPSNYWRPDKKWNNPYYTELTGFLLAVFPSSFGGSLKYLAYEEGANAMLEIIYEEFPWMRQYHDYILMLQAKKENV